MVVPRASQPGHSLEVAKELGVPLFLYRQPLQHGLISEDVTRRGGLSTDGNKDTTSLSAGP